MDNLSSAGLVFISVKQQLNPLFAQVGFLQPGGIASDHIEALMHCAHHRYHKSCEAICRDGRTTETLLQPKPQRWRSAVCHPVARSAS